MDIAVTEGRLNLDGYSNGWFLLPVRSPSGLTMKVRGLLLKGVIFNLLEQVVSEEAGEAAWERAIVASQ